MLVLGRVSSMWFLVGFLVAWALVSHGIVACRNSNIATLELHEIGSSGASECETQIGTPTKQRAGGQPPPPPNPPLTTPSVFLPIKGSPRHDPIHVIFWKSHLNVKFMISCHRCRSNCPVEIPKVQRCMVLLPGSPNNKANVGSWLVNLPPP